MLVLVSVCNMTGTGKGWQGRHEPLTSLRRFVVSFPCLLCFRFLSLSSFLALSLSFFPFLSFFDCDFFGLLRAASLRSSSVDAS